MARKRKEWRVVEGRQYKGKWAIMKDGAKPRKWRARGRNGGQREGINGSKGRDDGKLAGIAAKGGGVSSERKG